MDRETLALTENSLINGELRLNTACKAEDEAHDDTLWLLMATSF